MHKGTNPKILIVITKNTSKTHKIKWYDKNENVLNEVRSRFEWQLQLQNNNMLQADSANRNTHVMVTQKDKL